MIIDCDTCLMDGTTACDDCIVTALLASGDAGLPDRQREPVHLLDEEERALSHLAEVGLVAPLRLVPRPEAPDRDSWARRRSG